MSDLSVPERSSHQPPSGEEPETPKTAIYVAVLILEAIVIAALWALGRMYS